MHIVRVRRLVLGSTLESARERTACGGRKEKSAASALGVGKTIFCDFLGKYVWTGLGRGYGDSRTYTFLGVHERILYYTSSPLWLDSFVGHDVSLLWPWNLGKGCIKWHSGRGMAMIANSLPFMVDGGSEELLNAECWIILGPVTRVVS